MRHSRVNFKASRSTAILAGLLLCVALTPMAHSEEVRFDPFEASILELQVAMSTGRLSAAELTHYCLQRIALFDQDQYWR
jgi:hypothetical protein